MSDFTPEEKEAIRRYQKRFIDDLNNLDIVQVLHLERARKEGYICSCCGSGRGGKGTGAQVTPDHKRITCFANPSCALNGGGMGQDVFGALKATTGQSTDTILKEHFPNYDIREALKEVRGRRAPAQQRPAAPPAPPASTEPPQDFTPYFAECRAAINDPEAVAYLSRRGLSTDTAQRYGLGYDRRRHYLIIPATSSYYIARAATPEAEARRRYDNPKGATVALFNGAALESKGSRPLFVTEGGIDALSIIEAGGDALALNGISHADKLLEAVKRKRPAPPLVVALDNDKPGQDAADKLLADLTAAGVTAYKLNPQGKHHDANDALTHDPEALATFIMRANDAADLGEFVREVQRQEYRETNSAAAHLQEFINGIAASVDTPATSTGLARLDDALDGGLYPGLYTIGAISSLGKTSLILQICDAIAESGRDVLIISLEMARSELMAKSISRHTLKNVLSTGGRVNDAKTTRGITDGRRYERYSRTERDLIQAAIVDYSKYAQHVYILEGMGDVGALRVREAVQKHRDSTGETPVVVVDYVQILAPYNERATDKQNTDKNVLELKRLSRDFQTPVIAISSLNRENYNSRINMAAFKESGSLEYGSDVLIGLQYAGAGGKSFDADEAAKADPREIELVILKQRNGRKGDVVKLEYFPLFNYFREAGN